MWFVSVETVGVAASCGSATEEHGRLGNTEK